MKEIRNLWKENRNLCIVILFTVLPIVALILGEVYGYPDLPTDPTFWLIIVVTSIVVSIVIGLKYGIECPLCGEKSEQVSYERLKYGPMEPFIHKRSFRCGSCGHEWTDTWKEYVE